MTSEPARELKHRLELEKLFGLDSIPFTPAEPMPPSEPANPTDPANPTTDSLPKIAQEVAACTLCTLCESRTKTVFGVGNPHSPLMFVGEAPGRDEDRQGEPFVGRAGKLLDKIIETTLERTRSDVYIANILKCRPPNNRNPNDQEMSQCMPYLRRQIDLVRPKIICTLGAIATQGLLHTQETIGRLRGTFHPLPGDETLQVMPTYHPAYLLRNPSDKRKVWEDMKKLKARLNEL